MEVSEYNLIRRIENLEDQWALDPAPIPLRILSIAPDTSPSHAPPKAIHLKYEQQEHWFSFEPSRALLVNLNSVLHRYDPDLLLTSWGDTWLLPRLLAMSEECGIPLLLNRDRDAQIYQKKERWYFSYGQIVYKGQQIRLFGRWHIDRQNALFWKDYGLEGILEMARVTALPVQTAARVSPGTGISSIQMLAALRNNILVPWQKQQAEMVKPASDLFEADQGGLIFQPVMGVHRNVAFLDYVSLYPSAIVHFNISPETLGVNVPGAERVPELNLTINRAKTGIVPLALEPLLVKRIALKRRAKTLPRWDPRKETDKKRSDALKWLLVTCFGYLGYKNARFGRIEAHQAVAAYGREALLQAKEAAEDIGLEVLHAYVDGIWLKRADESEPERLDELVEEIERRTGLPIVVDGIFRWVVFLPSRVNDHRSVANRYFGVFQDEEIKARGIALRRRDTPAFIARVQSELLECLAQSKNRKSNCCK